MKTLEFFIIFLLFSHLILGNPIDSSKTPVHLQNSVEGFWEIQLGSDQIIFFINKDSSQNYSGSVITYKDGAPISNSKLGEITFDNSVLRMVTNPQNNIVFEGTLDNINQTINGNLHFSNGSERQFNLTRYTGPEQERIKNFVSPPKTQKYKTLDQLEKLNYNSRPELNPNKKYNDYINEIPLEKKDIISVINRWHGEIYPDYENRSLALLMAFLMDPVTKEISDQWSELIKNLNTTDEKIKNINKWTTTNLAYTQGDKQFANYPGKDPWGTMQDGVTPTFKKLIPSEMKAMQFYTNKISGKCFSLVNLISSCFVQLGVDPDDIVVVIQKSGDARHAMALIKYEGQLLLVNLIFVDFLKNYLDKDFGVYEIIGIYNHKFSSNIKIEIRNTDLQKLVAAPENSLIQSFIKHFKLEGDFKQYNFDESIPYSNREDISNFIFNDANSEDWIDLSKYAYQSLFVKYPEYYLTASLNNSLVQDLAKNFELTNGNN